MAKDVATLGKLVEICFGVKVGGEKPVKDTRLCQNIDKQ
jgi:hypothetical protein